MNEETQPHLPQASRCYLEELNVALLSEESPPSLRLPSNQHVVSTHHTPQSTSQMAEGSSLGRPVPRACAGRWLIDVVGVAVWNFINPTPPFRGRLTFGAGFLLIIRAHPKR